MWLHLLSVLALSSPCLHGQALHLSCTGVGSPLVILEAGAGRGADDWAKVQPTVGKLTQVCSYDRHPGHCCDQLIDDLRSALRETSFPPPYVLVGHSLGGLYVRRFVDRFPDDVSGLVLVDSADEKQLTGIIAPGLKPELYRPGAMSDSEIHAFFQDLGQRMMPAGAVGESARKFDSEDSGEIRMARFYRQIAADRHDSMYSEKPLIVLTAGQAPALPRFSAEQRAQLEEDHRILQTRMKLLSINSKQVLVQNSGHYVQVDRPDAVITAIRDVVIAVRSRAPLVP
jgi:pimeloyl-ACP methyl ester carboxylesterase